MFCCVGPSNTTLACLTEDVPYHYKVLLIRPFNRNLKVCIRFRFRKLVLLFKPYRHSFVFDPSFHTNPARSFGGLVPFSDPNAQRAGALGKCILSVLRAQRSTCSSPEKKASSGYNFQSTAVNQGRRHFQRTLVSGCCSLLRRLIGYAY